MILCDGGVRYSGFIAQDVEKAIPEAENKDIKAQMEQLEKTVLGGRGQSP